MHMRQANIEGVARLKKVALLTYLLPAMAFFLCLVPFIVPVPVLDHAYEALRDMRPPLFDHYSRVLASYPDWKKRLVSTYIMFLMSPLVVGSALVFILKALDPIRKRILSYELGKLIPRVAAAVCLSGMFLYGCLFLAGMDIVSTRKITNAIGIKSSAILTLEFWALGGMFGVAISELSELWKRRRVRPSASGK